jgi:ABC-type transporter MlaC component
MNLVVNGINLGQVLRNQFHQAMESKNDMDQVINEWAPTEGSEEINAMLDQETEV